MHILILFDFSIFVNTRIYIKLDEQKKNNDKCTILDETLNETFKLVI